MESFLLILLLLILIGAIAVLTVLLLIAVKISGKQDDRIEELEAQIETLNAEKQKPETDTKCTT